MIALNKQTVEFGKFPNGESYLDKTKIKARSYNRIEWAYEGDHEFFHLALLKDFLDSVISKSQITIYYMPHSRMDRANDSYVMSLTTAARMVNAMDFDTVTVVEPHSDVTPAVLNMSFSQSWCMEHIHPAISDSNDDSEEPITSLFFPDAGAAKRYSSDIPYGIGNKLRDFKTGEIVSYGISGAVGKHVLIVDDLCSRGGTFIEASKKLKESGALFVSLLVAHCENNVFTGELFDHIEKLYCGKFNMLSANDPQVVQLF